MSKMLATILLPLLLPLTKASKDDAPYSTRRFDSEVIAKERQFVLYTSSSIPSVQPYTSIFNAADANSSTKFLTIDCNADPEICNDADINAYPTIRLIEKSEDITRTIRYRGPRTKRAIKAFVKKHELPLVSHVHQEEIENFKEFGDLIVLATLPADGNEALLDVLADVAIDHEEFLFGFTSATTTSTSTASITVFKSDADHRTYTGPFSVSALSTFVKDATPSVIKTFREKDLEVFMQRDKLTLYIFAPNPSPTSHEVPTEFEAEDTVIAIKKNLTPLAKKFSKHVTFAIADSTKHSEMAENFFARPNTPSSASDRKRKAPMVVLHAPMNDNVFFYAQGREIEERGVEEMLMTILQGKAKDGEVFGDEAGDGHDEL